jgi:LysR family glycine cleavage system transcriptional activator
VIHGAVSRQIRHREAPLGLALVSAPKNRLALEDSGLKLADQLTTVFRTFEAAPPEPAGAGQASLSVSCHGSLAMKWLIPRLPRFHAAHPSVQVRICESTDPRDVQRDAVDLAIRMVAAPEETL